MTKQLNGSDRVSVTATGLEAVEKLLGEGVTADDYAPTEEEFQSHLSELAKLGLVTVEEASEPTDFKGFGKRK